MSDNRIPRPYLVTVLAGSEQLTEHVPAYEIIEAMSTASIPARADGVDSHDDGGS